MRTQMRCELVSRFYDDYVTDLRDDEEVKVEGAIKQLELIDTYLRVGWTDEAATEINEFEDRYGIDFAELVSGTQSRHLAELR